SDRIAAWFRDRDGDKVSGLLPAWIDQIAKRNEDLFIFVEADGARGKWLKAPAVYEPVVPQSTAVTVGILNLQALGQPFSRRIVHRLELVLEIVRKQENSLIDWRDLAILATAQQGIFQHSRGKKILLLTGAQAAAASEVERIVKYIRSGSRGDIRKCIAVKGCGSAFEPVAVHSLW
ncbi:MAG: selenium cofactor biosynthesis protein YqeC, partial [Veillonellales bacterium]